MSVALELLVRDQLLFRQVNDRIREVAGRLDIEGPIDHVCECSRGDCTDSVSLALDEYDSIRSSPTSFVIVPGHETLVAERVVHVAKRFIVVEKLRLIDEVIEVHRRRAA